jgi:hypothetical protein
METVTNQIMLSPDNVPVLSKTNAQTFHQMVKQRIYESGNGLFEYVETVKFMASLDKQINGDSASKIDPDTEFIAYVRDQIKLNSDKDNFTSQRGVKFTIAETGTSYDFSRCADPVLIELEEQEKRIKEDIKQRKDFLKTIPPTGMIMTVKETGETVEIFPPTKTSKSSFKVSLPK